MKQHPETMLLIEPDNATGMWKLVERETTWNGLRSGPMPVLSEHARIELARQQLATLKKKTFTP